MDIITNQVKSRRPQIRNILFLLRRGEIKMSLKYSGEQKSRKNRWWWADERCWLGRWMSYLRKTFRERFQPICQRRSLIKLKYLSAPNSANISEPKYSQKLKLMKHQQIVVIWANRKSIVGVRWQQEYFRHERESEKKWKISSQNFN